MPLSLPRLFRVIVLAALALHVFYMYSIARGVMAGHDEFGFHLGHSLIAAAFGLIMLIPLIWAMTLPEWPEMYTRHVRARRRYFSGCCPACGYTSASNTNRCSECGSERREPEQYRITPRTIRLFVAMNLLAWLIGIATAEMWALADERAFSREAAAHVARGASEPFSRPRWWPSAAVEMSQDQWLDDGQR